MSIVQTSEAPVLAAAERPVRGLSFLTLCRVELRKQLDTRASRGLLIAIVVVTALAMGLVLWVSRHRGAGLGDMLAATVLPQLLLLPVLGILTMTSEWSQRTGLVTFTQEPRRGRVVSAKALAAGVLGIGVALVVWLLAVVGHVVSMVATGHTSDISLKVPLSIVFGFLLVQVLSVLQGVAFGGALLSAPLAIVTLFAAPTVFSIVGGLISSVQRVLPWIDFAAASGPFTDAGWPTLMQWAHLGTAALLWVGLPMAIGTWRILHREIN